MSKITAEASKRYRDFCKSEALITDDWALANQRVELLDGGVTLNRIRTLYPPNMDLIYGVLAEKLGNRKALEQFMLKAMAAYNPLAFDVLLQVSYAEGAEWSRKLAEEVAGDLDDFADDFFTQPVPDGWVYTNPPFYHAYDIVLALYTALHASENWESWAIDFTREQQGQRAIVIDEAWAQTPLRPDDAAPVLDAYMRDIKPVLASLN